MDPPFDREKSDGTQYYNPPPHMPIQDDIDNANLGRLEREAKRQKRAVQQAPTVQYLGTDGATGQARVISGSGAASVRVANHSNTQARPGDIKRGFAGGFDRGNVRSPGLQIRRRIRKSGDIRILAKVLDPSLGTDMCRVVVGGHVETPIDTGLIVPRTRGDYFWLENTGEGDNDFLVAYYLETTPIGRIGIIQGDGTRWEIDAPHPQIIHRGNGIFGTQNIAVIRFNFAGIGVPAAPGARSLVGSPYNPQSVTTEVPGYIFQVPFSDENISHTSTVFNNTASGYDFSGDSFPTYLIINSHSFSNNGYQKSIDLGVYPYVNQRDNTQSLLASHLSTTSCWIVENGIVSQITGSYSNQASVNTRIWSSIIGGFQNIHPGTRFHDENESVSISGTYPVFHLPSIIDQGSLVEEYTMSCQYNASALPQDSFPPRTKNIESNYNSKIVRNGRIFNNKTNYIFREEKYARQYDYTIRWDPGDSGNSTLQNVVNNIVSTPVTFYARLRSGTFPINARLNEARLEYFDSLDPVFPIRFLEQTALPPTFLNGGTHDYGFQRLLNNAGQLDYSDTADWNYEATYLPFPDPANTFLIGPTALIVEKTGF